MRFLYVFPLVVLVSQVACVLSAESRIPYNVTLGGHQKAIIVAASTSTQKSLGLDEGQATALTLMISQIRRDERWRRLVAIENLWRKKAELSLDEHFEEGFVGMSGVVNELNDGLIGDIDRVILDAAKRKRFRQIFSQSLLIERNYNAIIRLHDLPITLKGYRKIYAADEENSSFPDASLPMNVLISRVAVRWLGRVISQKDLERAIGDEYEHTLVVKPMSAKNQSPFDHKLERSTMRSLGPRLATQALIQKHLAMSLEQCSNASKLFRDLHHGDIQVKLATARLAEILNEKQNARMKQLVVRAHIRRGKLSEAMEIAGVEFDPARLPATAWNYVQAEAHYTMRGSRLLRGMEVLGTVVSRSKLSKLCGELELASSPWSLFTTEKRSAKIEKDIAERVLARLKKNAVEKGRRSTNPRRASP